MNPRTRRSDLNSLAHWVKKTLDTAEVMQARGLLPEGVAMQMRAALLEVERGLVVQAGQAGCWPPQWR